MDGGREKGVGGNRGVGDADGCALVTGLLVPSSGANGAALVGYTVATVDAS